MDKKENWIFMRGLARGTGHWADFQEVLHRLRPDINAEFIDFPGNGKLSHFMSPIHPQQAIEELRDQSQFVRNNQRFHFCGLSLGGMLGLQWAVFYPEEFESLVIINSSLQQLSPVYDRLSLEGLFWLGKAALSRNLSQREWAVFKMVSNNEAKSKKFLKDFAFYAETHSTTPANTLRQLFLAKEIFIPKELPVPVKVLNSKSDHMVSPRCSAAIAKHLSCPMIQHPTAGHDLPFDEPDWVINQL